ncbi:hypothetical protein [Pelagibius marinus]|uniref:hypothetical protein n=1 Tax=Pelagibius marinus TaxID=2762760 RepID=UPI0018731338|nr:hypothetical protein [Pelagibius marinus]
MKNENLPALRYVLSAGRTGTVFLERLMNRQFAGTVTAAHEPAETRYQMMLGNLRNDWGLGGGLLKWLFERARTARVDEAGGVYVEINPFLCAITDLLPQQGRPLRVVHVVRDPASWARSIATFKASDRYRAVIDWLPFARPYPSPRPAGWRACSDYERALWRWNWCNQRIHNLRAQTTSFALVRYEDLFSQDEAVRAVAFQAISDCLDLPGLLEAGPADLNNKENPYAWVGQPGDRQAAGRICGVLARQCGYDY